MEKPPTFEVLIFKIKLDIPVCYIIIYHPPKPNSSLFLIRIFYFISSIVLSYDHILSVGDFNIHVDCPDNRYISEFLSISESFNLKQHVSSTHE